MPDERELARLRREYADLFDERDERVAPELAALLGALEAAYRPEAVPDSLRQAPPWPGGATGVPAVPVTPRRWQEPVRPRRPAFAASDHEVPRVVVPVAASPRRVQRGSRFLRPLLVAALLIALVGLLGSHLDSFTESLTRQFGTAPTVAAPTLPAFPVGVPNHPLTYSCFGDLTLVPTTDAVPITVAVAEARQREGYDLPFREGRLGTLVASRLVTIGYAPRGQLPPAIAATVAASVPTGRAWLLAFAKTPALSAVPVVARVPDTQLTSFYYALVDAESGRSLGVCDGFGALNYTEQMPKVPTEQEARQPLDAAVRAVGFPARLAGRLPFTPALSFARVGRLIADQSEVVADYFGSATEQEGERVRIISTDRTPLLATSERGGETIALADGQPARFDDLQTLQVLTWSEGGVWYQIIASRPRAERRPLSAQELITIAADLR